MELHSVYSTITVFETSYSCPWATGTYPSPCRWKDDLIGMTHPYIGTIVQIPKKKAGLDSIQPGTPVLTYWTLGHLTAQIPGQQLGPVAYPQYRNAKFVYSLVDRGSSFHMNGLGTTGENDPPW
jgi:hypothetical protein